tara:strand:+ start:218 stop:370 length:153 start_codon:yes stop_codon:yes gene_type:complete
VEYFSKWTNSAWCGTSAEFFDFATYLLKESTIGYFEKVMVLVVLTLLIMY